MYIVNFVLKQRIYLKQGIYTSSKAWHIEVDNSCNDSKTLQDYMRHVEQQSHGRKTDA